MPTFLATLHSALDFALSPDSRRPQNATSLGCETKDEPSGWAQSPANAFFSDFELAALSSSESLIEIFGKVLRGFARSRHPPFLPPGRMRVVDIRDLAYLRIPRAE